MLFPINLCTLVVRCPEPENLFVDSEQLVFSRLDPFFSFVELSFGLHRFPSDGSQEIPRLADRSAVRGFRGIRNLGKRAKWSGPRRSDGRA